MIQTTAKDPLHSYKNSLITFFKGRCQTNYFLKLYFPKTLETVSLRFAFLLFLMRSHFSYKIKCYNRNELVRNHWKP